MFMIEKSLVIIIFMYAASFSMLTIQYVFGDTFGITLVSFNGTPIKSTILTNVIDMNAVNTLQQNATSTSRNSIVNNPIGAAASMAYEILLLLTGTYIFNLLYLLGIPAIAIAGLVVIYVILMIRALIGYIRGI